MYSSLHQLLKSSTDTLYNVFWSGTQGRLNKCRGQAQLHFQLDHARAQAMNRWICCCFLLE
uniref:Uncharacterized protein n=1 Tax=Kalanchoe fedtschenkoi TaxID=63787 RepID=A0A7N0VNE5_KALFE